MTSFLGFLRRGVAIAGGLGVVALGVACGEDETSCVGDLCAQNTGLPGTTTDAGDNGGTGGATTGESSNTTGAVASGGLPCDVSAIVQAKCQKCHSDPPIGTYMPLVSQSHFQAASTTDPSRPYFQLAKERINADTDPMPPRTEPQLTAEEKATLNAWFDQGAPATVESCGGQVGGGSDGGAGTGGEGGVPVVGSDEDGEPQIIGEDIDVSDLECYRFTAHQDGDFDSKFKVGVVTDAYYSMAFAAPWEGTVYGAVVRPLVDNAQVLHHWLLYKEPSNVVDGSVQLTGGWHSGGELIAGYAPGGTAMDFRKHGDVGFELQDTNYSMEFHYNSGDADAVDGSGVEICVFREKPTNVATQSWVGYDHGYLESYVPAGVGGAPTLSGNCSNPSDNWVGTCDPVSNEPIHMLFLMPHMHEKGVHMKAVIVDEWGNEKRVLHDEPFDFNYQVTYEIDEVLQPGERIVTTCEFSAPACVGQATGAEMCYLYTYAWPAGALEDNTSWGPLAHGENTCLGQNFLF